MTMRWIEANGTALRCEMTGAGATTLVLVHEMGGTLETWDEVVPMLARSRRVLRYDVRGSGLSEKVRGPLHIDTLADDLAALLVRLRIAGPVAVAGCAVGAAISIHFAARHPDRVAGLVAMAPATFLPPERRDRALALADRLDREGLRAVLDAPPPAGSEADPSDPAELRRCRRLGNDPHGVAALWRMLAGLAMDEDFGRIRCPTLVLAGERDQSRPPALVQAVACAIPGARLRILDTGHVMPVDTPALIVDVLHAFLDDIGL